MGKRRAKAWVLGLGLAALGMASPFACVSNGVNAPDLDAGQFDGAFPSADGGGPMTAALPTSIDFGPSNCGAGSPPDKTVTISNTGGAELRISAALQNATAFSLSSTSATIPPNAQASFTLHALGIPSTATAGATITDTLFVTTNVPGFTSESIPVTITPQGATITLTPASASFGAVAVGTNATPIGVTVKNAGNATAGVSFGTSTVSQFSITGSSTLSLAPAGTGSVLVAFTPTSTQPVTGSIPIAVSGAAVCGASATALPVSSQLALPVAQVPTTTIAFLGPCGGAAPATQSLLVTNTGQATLHVTSAQFATSTFSVTSPTSFPLAVGPGANATLTLAAAAVPSSATAGAAITDTLTLATDDPTHASIVVPVSETPQGVTFSLSPVTAAFPPTTFGVAASPISITLRNTGNLGVIVTFGASSDSEFTLTYSGAPGSVALAANAAVPGLSAGYTPSQLGPVTATALFQGNEPVCGVGGPTSIGFSGTGAGAEDGGLFCDGGLCGDGCVPTACELIGPGACGSVQTCGTTIECGTCEGGAICDPATHTCQAQTTTCTTLGASCGSITDECGAQHYCGGCATDQVCDGATHTCQTCVPLTLAACTGSLCGTFPAGCVQSTATVECGACSSGTCSTNNTCNCIPLGACPSGACGVISDGCGGTLTCAACVAPECTGKCGAIPNACGTQVQCPGCTGGQVCSSSNICCTPATCAANQCDSIPDGCGGTTVCPACPGGGTCVSGTCQACQPKTTCAVTDCGATVPDGCGNTIDCSANSCADAGGACYDNSCCTPTKTSCGPQDCGSIPDGCGGTVDCTSNTCGEDGGQFAAICYQNQCCSPTPVTCSGTMCGEWDFGVGCGTGVDLDCGNPCTGGSQCYGGECCTPEAECGPNDCGSAVANCGNTLDCSSNTCPAGQECGEYNGGQCCTPSTTCGTSCSASLWDGCQYLDCSSSCGDGGTCNASTSACCTPLTCASEPNPTSCLPQSDGCGNMLTCFACPLGSVCEADGTCCKPAACPTGASGLVADGCGGTEYCTPP